MGKLTQLEKAIAAIEGEIAVLMAARERLQKQQASTAPKRKPKPHLVDAATQK